MAKKSKTKSVDSALKKEYTRVRKNLMSQVRSMSKRGYIFTKNPVPKLVKNPQEPSIKKLEKFKSELYEKSYAIVDGKKIKGTEYRAIEKSEASRKAAETRKRKNIPPDAPINIGAAIISTVQDAIRLLLAQNKKKSAKELDQVLSQQIKTYGETALAKSLAPFEREVVEDCDILIRYGSGSNQHQAALIDLVIILRGGEAPTSEESRRMSDAFEEEDADDVDAEGFKPTDINFDEL